MINLLETVLTLIDNILKPVESWSSGGSAWLLRWRVKSRIFKSTNLESQSINRAENRIDWSLTSGELDCTKMKYMVAGMGSDRPRVLEAKEVLVFFYLWKYVAAANWSFQFARGNEIHLNKTWDDNKWSLGGAILGIKQMYDILDIEETTTKLVQMLYKRPSG